MSSDTAKTKRSNKRPTVEQIADIIGSALFVAQAGGLVVEVSQSSLALSIRIAGLAAVDDNGEFQIVPLQTQNATTQNATTSPAEMPLQNASTG